MPRGRILFVDNNNAFRSTRAQFLTDYEVLHASSVEEAEQLLQDQWIHLVILDIRLEDDSEEHDTSGLSLAKHESYRHIPKIMLTGHPNYRDVREALGPLLDGLPAAVEFLAKRDGPDVLVQAVEKAFASHVRINWELDIQSNQRQPMTFPSLTSLLEENLEGYHIAQRALELEELFRRLFYDKSQITLDRLLWQRMGRVALTVFAFQEGTLPESVVVVCGQRTMMEAETERYKTFAPKLQEGLGTVLTTQVESSHFSANAYMLTQADLEQLQPLTELYKSGVDKTLHTALGHLLQETITAWHQNKIISESAKTLAEVYQERFEDLTQIDLGERVDALIRELPSLSVHIERQPERLSLHLYGQTLTYPEPIRTLYGTSYQSPAVALINSPGILSGDNILTDGSGHTWLTDFAEAGLAPQMWNIVALEAMVRFDWVEAASLSDLYDMEYSLMQSAFGRLDLRDIAPGLRRPVRAIQVIRQAAARMVSTDVLPYYLGMLFQAVSRLTQFKPGSHHMSSELVRFAHIIIATAMLSDAIEGAQQQSITNPISQAAGIEIDTAERAVWVDGVRITLTGQSYDLLCYLHQHANQLCTRRVLIERVFDMSYDETNRSQITRLNTAIARLREKIEADSSHPRYLQTAPGGGYRLVLPS